ncbi:MAG TPA: hypothetical protein DCR14_04470 [Acidimicrobiaceae bacterium]|nr:hypothetical protein [Acidimicrobiaceae bacterium]
MASAGAGMKRSTVATSRDVSAVLDMPLPTPRTRGTFPRVKMWCGRADTPVMHRALHRLLTPGLALALVTGTITTASVVAEPVAPADAASNAPWVTPTRPPRCTTTQINSGNVAGCVIIATSTYPENYGWPTPPFPEAVPGTVLPWVDLAKGSSGLVVARVQAALNANGATLDTDGQFGTLTENAVKAFQAARSLPVTGVVNQATADALGVQNTTFSFPPPGWNWLGWGYNGSPALAGWEANLASNSQAIGSVKKGQFRVQADALPLFEGFMAEIQARGYVIRGGAGAYVFRCTASTRKDCAGLTRAALSNHSYGLATDFNTVENPMRSYVGINGATACATPMLTDMPQWMIQVAEKWGLYWGGYGWSSGCTSPTQSRTSVTRDPMHFEFNGSPEQARAILRYNVGGGACFDVASTTGTISEHCLLRNEVPAADTRIVIDTDQPAGATAALVNITMTTAASTGYVTAEGCGAASGTRAWSNGNARPGRNVASASVVPLDSQGRFCLYQSASMHTIVDVQGFFVPSASAPSGARFTPVTASRSVDTRTELYCSPDSNCAPGPVAPGVEVVSTSAAPVDAVATLANLTVVGPATASYLTADSCTGLVPGPQTRSNLNFGAGDTVTNLAVVPSITSDQGVQFCTYSPAGLHTIVDVQGYFAPAGEGGLGFTAVTPVRVVDTRQCWTDPATLVQRCNQVNPAGSIVRVRAPAGAAAVMVNLTSVLAQAKGYVTAGSCDTLVAGPQATSNVNAVVGAAVANSAVVPVDASGHFCVYVSSTMHLAVDLLGTFSVSADLRFVPVSPVRVHDTRQPS